MSAGDAVPAAAGDDVKRPCKECCVSRLSVVAGLLSLGLLGASVGTDRWTYTSEPLHAAANATRNGPCGVLLFRAGLWRACPHITAKNATTNLAALAKYGRSVAGLPKATACISIPFLKTEMSQPVWKEAAFAGALLDRMRLSVPFFLVSLALVSLAALASLVGHVLRNANMLLAAVASVFAGLSLGGGLVIYVTVASEEYEAAVRQRAPPRWHEEDHLWHRYGASFYAACVSLLLQQLCALSAVSSYLRRLGPKGLDAGGHLGARSLKSAHACTTVALRYDVKMVKIHRTNAPSISLLLLLAGRVHARFWARWRINPTGADGQRTPPK